MSDEQGRIKSWWRRHDGHPRTRAAVLTGAVVAVIAAPMGLAATGDSIRIGESNSGANETKIVSNEREEGARTGGYTTRQSNTSSSGGGAIYGCRAATGKGNNPCIRANNLSTGEAFQFAVRKGVLGGEINVGSGGDDKKPFITNATGVATGLNADRVDGNDVTQLKSRWLLLNEAGQIEEQSGGFKVIDAYATDGNVYIDSGAPTLNHGFDATIAAQNKINTTGDAAADPSFSGQVAVARCQTPAMECAPAAAKTANAFVVAPRTGDGSATTADNRKRVYITVTE